jgi:hypothetical protein
MYISEVLNPGKNLKQSSVVLIQMPGYGHTVTYMGSGQTKLHKKEKKFKKLQFFCKH